MTDEKTKNYPGIEGNIEYGRIVQQLLFGHDAAPVTSSRAKTAQAPGGTGALRIAAEFVVRNNLAKTIWISDPTWANHVSVFQAAGLTVGGYKVLRRRHQGLDFAAMQASCLTRRRGSGAAARLLPQPDRYRPHHRAVAPWPGRVPPPAGLPLVDFAYQGFARGIEEDAEGLRIFAECHDELDWWRAPSPRTSASTTSGSALHLVCATKAVADVASPR